MVFPHTPHRSSPATSDFPHRPPDYRWTPPPSGKGAHISLGICRLFVAIKQTMLCTKQYKLLT